MPPLQLGVIGCGRIAQLVHLDALSRIPGVAVVALADTDAERLATARRRVPAARAHARIEDLLADKGVEAVVISLPTGLHADAAVAALGQGKHVYLEKPLGTDPEGARAALAAARRSGKTAMIGFNGRFHPLIRSAERHIASGRLGVIAGVQLTFCSEARALPDWKRRRATGGGCLLDLASHQIDVLRFLFGQPVREVSAQLVSRNSEDDTAALQVRLANGILAHAFSTFTAADQHTVVIHGTKAKLSLDRRHSLYVQVTPSGGPPPAPVRWARALVETLASPVLRERITAPRREPSYRAALTHFVDAARHGRPARPDFSDGYQCLAVVLAAEESARTGRTVTIPESSGEDPSP